MGRGLAALLPSAARSLESLRDLPLEAIRPNPRQPRRDFDEQALLALAESIRVRGVLQPIVVRPLDAATYELVAGERRLRAARLAELATIPSIVREVEDSARLELALMENMAREDLNPVEEARACSTLVQDLGLSKEELGRRLGRSRVAVSNLIRLLDLPDEVLLLIETGELSEGHGRALLARRDQADRRRLAREAAAAGWSVRDTERRARAAEQGADGPRAERPTVHPDLAEALGAAEDALTVALGHEVRVRRRGETACRVEFDVASPAAAIGLAERLLRRPSGDSTALDSAAAAGD
jgi:ParB family chromosome partitioning protein